MSIIWSFSAMAAQPTPATIENHLLQSSGGSIGFASGRTGKAYLTCSLPSDLGNYVRSLWVTYKDPDPSGEDDPNEDMWSSEVRGAIIGKTRDTGATIAIQNSIVSSNDPTQFYNPGANGWTTRRSGSEGNVIENEHHPDFEHSYYYVVLSLRRDLATRDVRIMGAYLTD